MASTPASNRTRTIRRVQALTPKSSLDARIARTLDYEKREVRTLPSSRALREHRTVTELGETRPGPSHSHSYSDSLPTYAHKRRGSAPLERPLPPRPPLERQGSSSDGRSITLFGRRLSLDRKGKSPEYFHHSTPPTTGPKSRPRTLTNASSESVNTLAGTTLVGSSPYASIAVAEFLKDDDGVSLLSNVETVVTPYENPGSSSTRMTLSRTSSLRSLLGRVTNSPTVDAGPSSQSLNPGGTGIGLNLSSFCNVISSCIPLERTQILSVECHKEWSRIGVLHRFLVFHLRRAKRSDVWLRLDRRASTGMSLPKLIGVNTRAEAQDTVILAGSKLDLISTTRRTKQENGIEFDRPPDLGVFRFFLSVICEELRDYHSWPENGYLLCSTLQEHLNDTGKGILTHGLPISFDMTHEVRSRIYKRIYHIPRGSLIADLFNALVIHDVWWREAFVPKALMNAKRYDDLHYSDNNEAIAHSQIIEVAESVRDVSGVVPILMGCLLAGRAVAFYTPLFKEDTEKFAERMTSSLATYIERLIQAGRSEDAANALARIVNVHKTLLRRNPRGHHYTKLVTALRKYATHLFDIEREEQGCAALYEIVEIYRELYKQNPEKWFGELDISLKKYADHMKKLGRRSVAKDASKEASENYLLQAVEAVRTRYKGKPDSDEQWLDLVASLTHYAYHLGLARQYEDLVAVTSEIVEIYRILYIRSMSTYRADLEKALYAHSDCLIKAGNEQDGRRISYEVVELYRSEFRGDPKRHKDCARVIDLHAKLLLRLGLRKAADEAWQEIVQMYRELYKHDPRTYHLDLARSLEFYSTRLTELGQEERAFVALREIVEMYRTRFKEKPDVHHSSLAESLNGYADQLTKSGKMTEAADASREIVVMYRTLCQDDLEKHHSNFAAALYSYSERLVKINNQTTIWENNREGCEMYRKLFHIDNKKYHTEFATALNRVADWMESMGNFEAACSASGEMVENYRTLYKEQPLFFYADFMQTLNKHSNQLVKADRIEEACGTVLDLVELDRVRYVEDPSKHQLQMIRSLTFYASLLMKVSRFSDAGDALIELAEVKRVMYKEMCTEHAARDFAQALCNCAEALSSAGRKEDAAEVAAESVEIDREFPPVFRRGADKCLERMFDCSRYLCRADRFGAARDVVNHIAKEMKRLKVRNFFDIPWLDVWEPKVLRAQRDLGRVLGRSGEEAQRVKAEKLGLL